MAESQAAPFRRQDPDEVGYMVRTLEEHCGKSSSQGGFKFSCKKSIFPVKGSRIQVTSWKMQDWDFKKPNLPTYSRGLFTYKNSNGDHEIAVRGYDKFFNHGEVRKTEWRNVETNTKGPYELSMKENGCIMFFSGLEDGTLLVCSKHSTGPRADAEASHAIAGEKWIDRQLAKLGKTRRDLALRLRSMNATAVAELCDDEFEEHVLAYTPDMAGLYLHGINLNLPEFATYPGPLIDAFADEWGFKKTMYIMKDDITTVKSFLDGIAETGAYAGRDTEGFVIRCQARDSAEQPFQDWFFKYKFEEPYLMYRQWRECTKAVISGKEPRIKKHKAVTEQYVKFAKQKLAADPELGPRYNHNHGIIKLRDDFLQEIGLSGADLIRGEREALGEVDDKVKGNVILVPVATIGCGKTTVALALAKLFNWGHIQNDNITGKARPPRFAKAICEQLLQYPVVIADRNNHQRRERQQLIDDVSRTVPNAQFVALHYVHDRASYEAIRAKMRQRVLTRGDNHQTIHAGSKGPSEIIEIMEGFMYRFEPLDPSSHPDDMFDLAIDLDVTKDSRENLETVVSALEAKYPDLFTILPTAQDLDEATRFALNDYAPDLKHSINGGKAPNTGNQNKPAKVKPAQVAYFGASIKSGPFVSLLENIFKQVTPETRVMYDRLKSRGRVQNEFHATLIHRANSSQPNVADYWKKLNDLNNAKKQKAGGDSIASKPPVLGSVAVLLERLVWDERVMCMVVRLIPKEGNEIPFKTVNSIAHVTVGTADASIKPKESNDLLDRWTRTGAGKDTGIHDLQVGPAIGHTELPAEVAAVVLR